MRRRRPSFTNTTAHIRAATLPISTYQAPTKRHERHPKGLAIRGALSVASQGHAALRPLHHVSVTRALHEGQRRDFAQRLVPVLRTQAQCRGEGGVKISVGNAAAILSMASVVVAS